MKGKNVYQVFEYETIDLGSHKKPWFEQKHLDALARYHDRQPVKYFSLTRNGVQFSQYVGVIQVADITIEILPKTDKDGDEAKWHDVLLQMLRECRLLKVESFNNANLQLRSNSILELYIDLFLTQVELLQHQGLAKKYRTTEGNINSWKGRMLFNKQLSKNLTHQERFYTAYQTYDVQHILHKIISKALRLIPKITINSTLVGKSNQLLLNFPEMPDIKVSETTFEKIVFNRKTERYKTAIEIARLLLLQYSPDIRGGKNDVLALLFDMNKLWEEFVYRQLLKNSKGKFKVRPNATTPFWRKVKLEPDIVIEKNGEQIVIDTKWKRPNKSKPSYDDLRQVFAYGIYFQSKRNILLYPTTDEQLNAEGYFKEKKSNSDLPNVKAETINAEMRFAKLQIKEGGKRKQYSIQGFGENLIEELELDK